ncbi:MAG: hypothetical protein JOZ78_25295 [Chroococcidiopsidaceae cyanobacterium CP_BM_ER_R8_30]|nr:hypothetical protein [Chroococcidiopsidaceae cyanobacterium CP_BM_ER_R8_30]
MFLGQTRCAIGRFSNRLEAEQVLGELNRAGLLIAQISIVAKTVDYKGPLDTTRRTRARVEAIEEAAIGAAAGGMLGAIFGWLASLGILMVPGVGLLVAAGTTTGTALAIIFAGTGIGAFSGGLILALATSKISFKQAIVARHSSWRDEFLVMVDGTDDEVSLAKHVLSRFSSGKVWIC